MRSRSTPLSQLDAITRIEVRNPAGADSGHVIRDPAGVARAVAAVRAIDSGWEQANVTVPAGDVAVLFYRDRALVGAVWLGQNSIVARGADGKMIRSAGPEELVRLAEAFELPRKVIMVPPRGTT